MRQAQIQRFIKAIGADDSTEIANIMGEEGFDKSIESSKLQTVILSFIESPKTQEKFILELAKRQKLAVLPRELIIGAMQIRSTGKNNDRNLNNNFDVNNIGDLYDDKIDPKKTLQLPSPYIQIISDVEKKVSNYQLDTLSKIIKKTAWSLMSTVASICFPLIVLNIAVLSVSQQNRTNDLIKLNVGALFTCLGYGFYKLNNVFKSTLKNMVLVKDQYSGQKGLLSFCRDMITGNSPSF